jgi:microcystin-dependent protein
MSCESCYNGCVQVTPDECVRYTGAPSVPLGIETGDTLLSVEEALITTVVSFLNGQGINITVNPQYYCALVSQYLPSGTAHTVPQMFTALVRAACNLQTQVTGINGTLDALNANYTVGCLTGVTPTSGTHAIVQAAVNKLCSTASGLTALSLDVSTNYVKLSDLNTLIQAYLDSQSTNITQQYKKMVPYTVVEYYGPLTNFDGTGAGISSLGWDKIYLCNGSNGTPDKRGRVGVGAIKNVPGGPLNASVNPIYSGNPNYDVQDIGGVNTVVLNANQMPSHTHASTSSTTISPNPHDHGWTGQAGTGWPKESCDKVEAGTPCSYAIITQVKGVTLTASTNVIIQSAGSGQAHNNIQPVIAAYYIMYIPS